MMMKPSVKVLNVKLTLEITQEVNGDNPVTTTEIFQFDPPSFHISSYRDLVPVIMGGRTVELHNADTHMTITGVTLPRAKPIMLNEDGSFQASTPEQFHVDPHKDQLRKDTQAIGEYRARVSNAMLAEAAAPLMGLPRDASVTEHPVNDLRSWLAIALAARTQGSTITPHDDPRLRVLGFIIEEESKWFYISLNRIRASQDVPKETKALMQTPEGRYELLLGHPMPTADEDATAQGILEDAWMKDAEVDRPQDMGVIPLERPKGN